MTLEEQLADAQKAYHDLQTGVMARVVVDQNGDRVEYTSANRDALRQYIARLELLVSPPDCEDLSKFAPAGFLF
jgi:tRNA(Arg) A34 adenosine deaminase TadA